ncbi:T9SS type A sorting domain-containing protein [Sabulibacter ruber]|uniref:T9SS type A sorting domain-containing protein n=1 Tax=Sabulibacter ruber TaxID=2811901 RepID=UPI001A97A45A|nr:T9SS type A sorting domain-containing protein [Sabulibacter ruber]
MKQLLHRFNFKRIKGTQGLLLLCVGACFNYNAFGQSSPEMAEPITIYKEDFSNPVIGVSTPIGATAWAQSNAVKNDFVNSSGRPYLAAGTNSSTASVFYISNGISTVGYQNLTISWIGKKKTGTVAKNIKLEYSVNGGSTYQEVNGFADVVAGSSNSTSTTDWKKVNNGTPISLPKEIAGVTNVLFRWTFETVGGGTYSIDDILISGKPMIGTSTFSWASRSMEEDPTTIPTTSPYKVGDVTMSWTKSVPTSITGSTKINSTFDPRKVLHISQTGAGSTSGGAYTLTFNKTVENLTFTIIDVDRTDGQYRDAVVVKGYTNSKAMIAPKQRVQVTRVNEYDAISGKAIAKLVDAHDNTPYNSVPNNSTGADITYTFPAGVDKLEITYYNEGASGIQGIGISDITFSDPTPSPLPVTLTAFSAKKALQGTELYWATASETNNEKFVVEKSSDAKTFIAIGEVQGAGNSNTLQKYTFVDLNTQSGTTYYRLTQYDFDGKSESSRVIALETKAVAQTPLSIKAYPNPFEEELTINVNSKKDGKLRVAIYNITGKKAYEKEFAVVSGVLTLIVPLNNISLNPGMYILSTELNGDVSTTHLIKK